MRVHHVWVGRSKVHLIVLYHVQYCIFACLHQQTKAQSIYSILQEMFFDSWSLLKKTICNYLREVYHWSWEGVYCMSLLALANSDKSLHVCAMQLFSVYCTCLLVRLCIQLWCTGMCQ